MYHCLLRDGVAFEGGSKEEVFLLVVSRALEPPPRRGNYPPGIMMVGVVASTQL